MSDELTTRRLAKRHGDRSVAAARAMLNSRAKELRPHGPAIIELLQAVGIRAEQMRAGRSDQYERDSAKFVLLVAAVLGVPDATVMTILEHILGQEAMN